MITAINRVKKNDLLPTLISIGHEQSPLSEEITSQVSDIVEVANATADEASLRNIVSKKLRTIKQGLLAVEEVEGAHRPLQQTQAVPAL